MYFFAWLLRCEFLQWENVQVHKFLKSDGLTLWLVLLWHRKEKKNWTYDSVSLKINAQNNKGRLLGLRGRKHENRYQIRKENEHDKYRFMSLLDIASLRPPFSKHRNRTVIFRKTSFSLSKPTIPPHQTIRVMWRTFRVSSTVTFCSLDFHPLTLPWVQMQ